MCLARGKDEQEKVGEMEKFFFSHIELKYIFLVVILAQFFKNVLETVWTKRRGEKYDVLNLKF